MAKDKTEVFLINENDEMMKNNDEPRCILELGYSGFEWALVASTSVNVVDIYEEVNTCVLKCRDGYDNMK